jgi:hypothetical protein
VAMFYLCQFMILEEDNQSFTHLWESTDTQHSWLTQQQQQMSQQTQPEMN